ncbi:MAG TPA: PEP-CTERM sorting domain-containing protein [Aquabacterium sp.]|uniref:PEP-CTERM sorting domain-containing protein n=1 Tax=Aquabacterium sp. TaxID=1872578 RepID=UPI002E380448|nr:PEP-CTERM sorting domain-containing protein [Aquabacterium sp.]HEX5372920.1 PEP-CTERM sorting domain-containing protein [Aquabacterium sp.]
MTPIAVALSMVCVVGSARATVLAPNSIANSVDVVAGGFGGTLLDSAITPISNSSYNGIARAAVYDTGTGMDFYYQFSSDISSSNGLERFSGHDYSSIGATNVEVFQTAAAFDLFVAGTEQADGADRTVHGVIGVSFVPNGLSKINPGTTSYTQIIRTNARAYQVGGFGLLNGIGDNAVGFAPAAAPVPEPATYAMFMAGLGLLGLRQWRRLSVQNNAA